MAKISGWIWAGLATLGGAAAVLLFGTPAKTKPSMAPSDHTTPPGPSPAPVPEPLLKSGQTLLLLGDSIANGLAAHLAHLAAREGIVFRYAAQDSSTIMQWAARVRDDVTIPRPAAFGEKPIYGTPPSLDAILQHAEILVLSLGSNDSPGEAHSLKALADRLRDVYGLKVVWLVPPMYRPGTKATEQQQAAMAAIFGAVGVDPLPAGSALVPLGPDNVHPTATGYQQLAANVMLALLSP